MGRKQMIKKYRGINQKTERLVGLGQPIVKEHRDKYKDKVEQERIRVSYCESNLLLGQIRAKNEDSYKIDTSHNSNNSEDKLIKKKERIRYGLSKIGDLIEHRNYQLALSEIILLTHKFLKQDFLSKLGEEERNNINDSISLLEEICLAYLTPSIDEQEFNETLDIEYLENGSYITTYTPEISQHPEENDDEECLRVIDIVPMQQIGRNIIYGEVQRQTIDIISLKLSQRTKKYFQSKS